MTTKSVNRFQAALTALGAALLSLCALPLALFSPRLSLSLMAWGAAELTTFADRKLGKRMGRGTKAAPAAVPSPIAREVASTLKNQGMEAARARTLAEKAAQRHPDDFDLALRYAIKEAA